MPVLAHPLYAISLITEVFRATLVMNLSVSHLGITNTEVPALGIVNQVVGDRYDELEDYA